MLIKNAESADLSNLLYEALENLNYPSERINHYVLIVEEALMQWREGLSPDSELEFTRNDRGNDAIFEFTVKDRKLDPFAKDAIINYEKPIRTMYDRLLSGIGSELRYSYRNNVNKIFLRLPKSEIRETLFCRTAISSVVPFSAQNLINTVASNMGIIILGFLSSEAMSGVSFACQIVLINTMLIQAVNGAVNSVLSQFWGKRNGSSAIFAMWMAIGFSTIICLLEFIVCFFFPQQMIGLYTNIPELIKEGAVYLKIVSIAFLFNSFSCIFYAFLQVTNQGKTAVKIIFSGCALNLLLNVLLVFGKLGLPRLGVAGSAIGMAAGSVLQFILCIICYRRIKPSFYNADDAIDRKHIVNVFFRNALPVFAQYGAYLLGTNFIAAAIGRINADVIAAYSFVNAVNLHFLSIRDACANVSSILAGCQLGRKRFEDARYENRLLSKLALKIGIGVVLTMILFIFLSRFLPLKLDAASRQYLMPIALTVAFNDIFGFLNVVNTNALYAGGQARYVLYTDAANALLYSVPLSLISIKLNCFAPLLLIFLCRIDEVITVIPKFLSVKRGKWLQNIVE